MTSVVTEKCNKCKYMDCVEVCPVDCFYEGEKMLVINPVECIDFGVCNRECPVEAIVPDAQTGLESWLKLNARTSRASAPSLRAQKLSMALPASFKRFHPVCRSTPLWDAANDLQRWRYKDDVGLISLNGLMRRRCVVNRFRLARRASQV